MKTVVIYPAVKLMVFLMNCVFVMSNTQLIPNLLIGIFIFLLLVLSGETKNAVYMLVLFVLSLVITNYYAVKIQGVPGALILIFCLLIRIIMPVAMSFNLVFKTTTISQFMSAFKRMKVSSVIAIPFAVMFRFIPTLQEEWNGIRQAMAFRGIKISLIKHPVISLEYILVPLIFSAASIMDELAAASLARGLDSEQERTCAVEVRMKWYDWLFSAIILAFFINWIGTLV